MSGLSDLKYTYCPSNSIYWAGVERNRYGFEVPPPPRIPYLLWPFAIAGALLFAWSVNWAVKR
jgi:hypothetical protein